MKLVVFSDLHLDTPFHWASADHARHRRSAIRRSLENIVQVAEEVDAAAILCAGDLYEHERVSPDTEEFVRSAFNDLAPMRVFLAPGNHDWYGPESLYARVQWNDNVHVFTEPHLEPVRLDDGLTLWGGGHRAPANTGGFLDEFLVTGGGVHIGLFHGSESGWIQTMVDGKIPHAPFLARQIPESGLNHAFVGHFHTPRDAEYHTYPGNPEPLTFGESGSRGVVIATIADSGSVDRQRRSVATTSVHDLSIDITGAESGDTICQLVGSKIGDLTGAARVTLCGSIAPHIDFQRCDLDQVDSTLDAVVYDLGGILPGYDFEELADEETILGSFVRDVLDADLDDGERARVLTVGVRALEGRTDLEVY